MQNIILVVKKARKNFGRLIYLENFVIFRGLLVRNHCV